MGGRGSTGQQPAGRQSLECAQLAVGRRSSGLHDTQTNGGRGTPAAPALGGTGNLASATQPRPLAACLTQKRASGGSGTRLRRSTMCTYSPAPQLINTPPRPQPSRYTPASRRGGWGRGKSECGVHHRSKHVAGTCCGLANLQTSHCAASSAFASCPHCCTSSAAVLQPGRPACAPVGDEYRRLRRSGLAEKYWEWRTAGWKRQPTCGSEGRSVQYVQGLLQQ